MIERLVWHDVATALPDAGQTVLVWVRDTQPFASYGWMTGYLEDGRWHDSETGHAITEWVTHWADPEGPGAAADGRALGKNDQAKGPRGSSRGPA